MFGNLNRIASRYIPQQKVLWFRFKERGPDDRGNDQNYYYEPVEVRGSWQAVDTQDVQSMGLNTSQVYRLYIPLMILKLCNVVHPLIFSYSMVRSTMLWVMQTGTNKMAGNR